MSVQKYSGQMFLIMTVFTAFVFMGNAFGAGKLQNYFNNTAREVKAAPDPTQKREILNNEFRTVSGALNAVENMPQTSDYDRVAIERYKDIIQDKSDELSGKNGFVRVPDNQLNAFADYTVQDAEQADTYITISLVTLLLIIIILLLIVR